MQIGYWIKKEVLLAYPAIIYFLIAFNLIHFTTALARDQNQIPYFTFLEINLGALLMGKILIIANTFSMMKIFYNKPLIYNILWKFFIYVIFIFSTITLDILFHFFSKLKNMNETLQFLSIEITSPVFWSLMLWIILVFLIFVIFTEFTRVIGKLAIKKILFG